MTISTISNNTAGSYIGTYNGVTDSKLVESTPTTVGPTTGDYLYATSWTASQRSHSVIQFPTSSIATNQTVSNADFNIKVESGTGVFAIYQLKVQFVAGQVSWNERSTGVAWTSTGGLNSTDVDTTPLATATVTANGFVTLNSAALTALVNGWVNGTIANYGLLITYYPDAAGGSKQVRFFRSPSAYDSGPALVITHATGVTIPTASISDVTVTNLSGNAVLTVSLSSAAPAGGVAGLVNTSDITALAGVDYTGQTNVPFSIAAGQTSGTITIPITP